MNRSNALMKASASSSGLPLKVGGLTAANASAMSTDVDGRDVKVDAGDSESLDFDTDVDDFVFRGIRSCSSWAISTTERPYSDNERLGT